MYIARSGDTSGSRTTLFVDLIVSSLFSLIISWCVTKIILSLHLLEFQLWASWYWCLTIYSFYSLLCVNSSQLPIQILTLVFLWKWEAFVAIMHLWYILVLLSSLKLKLNEPSQFCLFVFWTCWCVYLFACFTGGGGGWRILYWGFATAH